MSVRFRYFLILALLAFSWIDRVDASQDKEHPWIAETVAQSGFNLGMISATNFQAWMKFVEPTLEELDWNAVRWHHSLSAAVAEAKKINRPILLWTMNGHPFSET